MKSNKIITLFMLLLILNVLVATEFVYGLEKFSIGNRKPKSNGKVETMNVVLELEVLSNNEPVPYAWVNFYIDDEWIGSELTDSSGVARNGVVRLDEFGSHTWQVRLNKQGYDRMYSTVWKFNYQPRPILKLYSDYGETYGEGNYTYGETSFFGVESDIINIDEGERLVFVEWISVQENGYSGQKSKSNVTMLNDISERALWKTQYYLDMSCELPQTVSPRSGWYDKGDLVGIRVEPLPGTEFKTWTGFGNESYSGTDMIQAIHINGPIKEEAVFDREDYALSVESEHGNPWGGGEYPAWENVSFGIENPYIYLSQKERMQFIEWSTDSSYGYKGNMTEYQVQVAENINQRANWKKQYYVNVSSNTGGNVTILPGWMDENSRIVLEAKGEEDYQFVGWRGEGEESYTGLENNYTLVIKSPVEETALWKRICTVIIESELPVKGVGEYLEGQTVTLEATPSQGLLIRKIFRKWSGDIDSTNNPFTFTVSRDMEITVTYTNNYTYVLVVGGLIIAALGIILYKMLD